MTVVVMKIVTAGGSILNKPVYLKAYDVNAFSGRGSAELTENRDEALRFADFAAMMEAWRTQSSFRPIREDGKPNRPLTAYTIEGETIT